MTLATTTVRISNRTHRVLQDLARNSDLSMQEVVEQALELYRRQQLLKQANIAYAALYANPAAKQEAQEEWDEWDVTVNDGLEDL